MDYKLKRIHRVTIAKWKRDNKLDNRDYNKHLRLTKVTIPSCIRWEIKPELCHMLFV